MIRFLGPLVLFFVVFFATFYTVKRWNTVESRKTIVKVVVSGVAALFATFVVTVLFLAIN